MTNPAAAPDSPHSRRPRPTAVLAMSEGVRRRLFTDAHIARLRMLCELPDDGALTGFDDPGQQDRLSRAQVLVTSWGCPRIDDAAVALAPRLELVAHAAGTVKGHVSETCWERGVLVTSAAAANAIPVAEYTLAAILFANKGVLWSERRYRSTRGDVATARTAMANVGNHGKTVGIVGASHVGRLVMERLRPFDLSVVVADPFVDPSEAAGLGAQVMKLDDLLVAADVVSLHAPALDETHHLLDRRRLALLRDGTTLINTARGALVDQAALVDELTSGRLWAVLDTTTPEPLPQESPLFDLPNVFVTPHIAGSLGTESRRMVDLALDEVARYVAGEPLLHEVRRADLARIA